MVVLGLNARRFEPHLALLVEQEVDRGRARGVSAFDEHGFRAEPPQRLGLRRISSSPRASLVPRSWAASGRLGVMTTASGINSRLSVDGIVGEQHVAARRHHHRIDHHGDAGEQRSGLGDGLDDGARGQHAGLDRADREIGRHGLHLREHEIGGTAARRRRLACSARSAR